MTRAINGTPPEVRPALLHLIKLSVGTEDIEDLARWQAGRLARHGRVFHKTRMMPRRGAELLAGGSIYWVIKGKTCLRQRLIGLEREVDEEGRPYTFLLLDPELVRTVPRSHRPFQGWRYLSAEDAPPDLGSSERPEGEIPPELAEELRALGIL
jgi:hypothetical protein